MESLISFPTYQDEMSCYPIMEDQTLGVSSLVMLLLVLFLHGWLRTMMMGHLLCGILMVLVIVICSLVAIGTIV
jgi:hypothetical protein